LGGIWKFGDLEIWKWGEADMLFAVDIIIALLGKEEINN
jgi:hypothetical protein